MFRCHFEIIQKHITDNNIPNITTIKYDNYNYFNYMKKKPIS